MPRIKPEQMIHALNDAGVEYVLFGKHGAVGYLSQSTATEDVDVLIAPNDFQRSVQAIHGALPKLALVHKTTRVLFVCGERILIDLWKPSRPLFREVFRNTVWIGDRYRIPKLEILLVLKYSAMLSPERGLAAQYTGCWRNH